MTVVSMNYLLEAGVHFGHQTKRWNPKMKEYIFTSRDDIYIIDLQKTAKAIEEAYVVLKGIAQNGGKVLFVGTKKQANDATREEALRSNSYYVTERWLGGTLTNFKTIRGRVKRLEEIESMEKNGLFEVLPKKEIIGIKKEYNKLNSILCGIRDMYKLPEALFIVDPSKEEIAIREAKILGIPIFGIVDTNCDPDMIDYVIPGNDDAIRSVKLILGVMANAIVEAQGGELIDYVSEKERENGDEIMKKALETVSKKSDKDYERKPRKEFKRDKNRSERFRPMREDRIKITKEEKPKIEKENNINIKKEDNIYIKKEDNVKIEKEETKSLKEEKATTKKAKVDLSTKTVAELRELAKAKDIKGYSTMKKAELLEALK